jgi:hypothetical protein
MQDAVQKGELVGQLSPVEDPVFDELKAAEW